MADEADSSAAPAPREDIFAHADPFYEDAVQHPEETNALAPARTEADDDVGDDDQLTGVVSDNPFAVENDRSGSHAAEHDVDTDAVAPEDRTLSSPVVEPSYQAGETAPSNEVSHSEAFSDSVDPRDTSVGGGSPGRAAADHSDLEAAPVEPTNSNINQDRAEPGTDIFMTPQSPIREDGDKTEGVPKTADGNPRVAFTGTDKIDKASSQNKDKDEFDTGRHASIQRGTVQGDRYDFTGKVGLTRGSVVARTFLAYPNPPPPDRPRPKSTLRSVGRNLFRMFTTFPYWDMAFWAGFTYTWGSVLFTMTGVWAWGPVGWDVTWEVEGDYVIGIFFFIGALLYQLGATMAYFESINNGSFQGHAMKRFLEGHDEDKKAMLDEKVAGFFDHLVPHHHHDEQAEDQKPMAADDPTAGWKSLNGNARKDSVYAMRKPRAPRRGGVDLGEDRDETYEYTSWRWWPTWESLKTYHVHEVGYIACSIQLFGATLFSWCGLVSIPGFSSTWEADATWYGGYWLPEVLGSVCFLGASFMFIYNTRKALFSIEWFVGFWAMVGSWGFLLNGIFGVVAQARPELEWAEYTSECCTTWGSFGYLLSGMWQFYAATRHSVEEEAHFSNLKESDV